MEIKLNVGGMSCSSCAKSVMDAFSKIPGVKDTVVDLDKKTVTVVTDSNGVQESVLKKTVEDLGFDVL